jgi:hypothetical protein
MAPRKPQDIGREAERLVTEWLAANGWPYCERRRMRGAKDAGDITGTPGLCWSVKGGAYAHHPSDRQIGEWLDELENQREHAGADHGVLITRRYRIGNPGRWWAWARTSTVATLVGGARYSEDDGWMVTHLEQAVRILRVAGYGSEVTL